MIRIGIIWKKLILSSAFVLGAGPDSYWNEPARPLRVTGL